MRRFVSLFLVFIFTISLVSAYSLPQLDIDGKKFKLYYSSKNPELGTYMNEYFKPAETYASWTELFVVHHYPNAYNPIEQAKFMREFLGELNYPSAITINEEENNAILDFILIADKKLPIVLEFNVFKYEKNEICGTSAIQYSKRFVIKNALEVATVKKDIEKSREKYLKLIKKVPIPKLVSKDIDKGVILNTEAIISNPRENLE